MNKYAFEIINKISELGFEAYIVGGFARDLYMGINTKDIDICTSARYEDLKNYFKIKKVAFGSMIIKYKFHTFEVTTFRKELGYVKNRFPKKIEYVKTLAEDLERRDFIINTLCIDKEGNFVDLKDAASDIDAKIIRCVGDADTKIEEDSLRILRAIRFAAMFNFKLDHNLKKAIKKHGYLLRQLSDRRKKEEVKRIMNADYKIYAVELMIELGIYEELRPYILKYIRSLKK